MAVPSSGTLIVRPPQYVEEVTFGTTPAVSPTLLWIGVVSKPDLSGGPESIDIPAVATEDPYTIIQGKALYKLKLSYLLQQSTFAKYGVVARVGAGTIDKSVSVLWSAKLNDVENYYFLKGARINSLTLKGGPGKPTSVDVEMWGKNSPLPNISSGLTTPTFATDPATAPWRFEDGGAAPITWNAVAVEVTEITVKFARNLKPVYAGDNAAVEVLYMPPAKRLITGSMTVVHTGTALLTDILTPALRTLAWVLKSATSTLTLTNVRLNPLDSLEMPEEDVTYEKISFIAKAAALT